VLHNREESSQRPKQTEEHVAMVSSWPCKVSSEIHINERHVSEPVRKDKGKMTVIEPKDEKDPKRAHVVPSKGREVVGLGYSRLTGAAANVTDRGENSGNPGRINQVSKTEQHYPILVSQVSQNSSTDQRAGRVTRVGNMEQKIGGSSWVANMESWVMENSANTESRVTENLGNMESLITENLANMKNWVM
jgi:hypothetical protein